jgi:tetratricopeptide (TPR) repeat protein
VDQLPAAAGEEAPAVQTPVAGRLSDTFSLSSSVVLPGAGRQAGRKPPSYWQSVAHIGVQVAEALEYAHRQGIQHRDVKPSNLLLDTRGTVWVADFGLAKTDDQQNLTHTGDVLGTLRYLPPEAFEGRADARGDVYSLGLTLYELLCLRPAFAEEDRNRLLKQVTTEEPPRLERLNREIPRDLVTIVHKAIERDLAHRYPTAGALAADLQRFLDDEPIQARRQTQVERYLRWARRHPGIAVLGAALTAVLVLATVASLLAAGHFNRLRWNEAQAAQRERDAREQEAKERERAEQARQAADASRTQALKALQRAEENYARARAAVNDYLTAISDDPRLREPGLSPLRAQLLQSALGFYQDFLKEEPALQRELIAGYSTAGARSVIVQNHTRKLQRELAAVYYKVGRIYSELGKPQAANQSFAQSRRLYEALAGDAPDDPALQDGLAQVLVRLGHDEQAAAIWEKLIRPDDPRYHVDLGWAYNECANVAGTKKDSVRQLEFLRKALAVRERLVKLRPDDTEARQGLAASLNNIANCLAPGPGFEAERLALYRRSAAEMEVAYQLRSDDSRTVRNTVTGLGNVAGAASRLGHTDEAVARYRRVAEIQDRWARENPDVPGTAGAMVGAYRNLLGYLRQLGRLDEAARAAERCRERIAEATEETAEFFYQTSSFDFAVLDLAHARAKTTPDGEAGRERAAAEAVAGLRRRAFFDWWDAKWMRSAPMTEPLRGRADFQELLARMDDLSQAGVIAANTSATPEAKLAARQTMLTALEALAGPAPTARYVRRTLAQARQYLGEAYLGAGRAEEAKAVLDEALAIRQKLVEEAPKNDQLRADLAVSQTAAGDLLARGGKLADAAKTWEAGLATLEAALKASPNSIPFQAALLERRLHVGCQYGLVGMWDRAAEQYRAAFAIQTPTQFAHWCRYAALLAEIGDTEGCRKLAQLASTVRPQSPDDEEYRRARTVLAVPSGDARWTGAVRQLARSFRYPPYPPAEQLFRAVAFLRLGEANEALALADRLPAEWKWTVLALSEHLLGHADAAREALQQADLVFDQLPRNAVSDGALQLPFYWEDWLELRALRREAHQAIHGKPPADSLSERLRRGRLLVALDRPNEAEAEFAAAVALRPDDPEAWLTRARLFAKLGRKDRAAADMIHAQQLKADDPKSWVATGRVLAEMGDQAQADAAFARAAAAGKGALYPFLEGGWWLAGPYPEPLDLACPPEFGADPSKPVAAVGRPGDLKWQPVSTAGALSTIQLRPVVGEARQVSYYALAYAYADRDRTAALNFAVGLKDDARVWVNGRRVFDGFAAWKQWKGGSIWIPVTLRAGRNTVLLKISHADRYGWCNCQFHDHPSQQAHHRVELGAWSEAADAFAAADRRSPLEPWQHGHWLQCLVAAGRWDEYRREFAELLRRHDRPGADLVLIEPAAACYLPPEKSPERERRLKVLVKCVEDGPKEAWRHFCLGHAYLRAGRFEEAEKSVRTAMQLADEPHFGPVLATTLHYRGRADEARTTLRKAEERYAKRAAEARTAGPYRMPLRWDQELVYQATLPEARALILGPANAASPDVQTVVKQRREWLARTDRMADDYARLVQVQPHPPRLWIDQGRRLGELGRWDEAAAAFARAVELAPKDPQVWKERGRAYADRGKWDEAAADLATTLDLTPAPRPDFPSYPWRDRRSEADELVAGSAELFDRLTKVRPKDSTLSARRVEHFAAAGRWAEAEAALRNHVDRFPDDWWAPCLLAKLLLLKGDKDGHRQVCRHALERSGGENNSYALINIARAALLAPAGFEDHPLVQKLLADADKQDKPEFWMQTTAALAELRRGDEAAIKRLDARVAAPTGYFANAPAFADAVRALAYHKAGRAADARAALERARVAVARHRQRPAQGPEAYDWHNWIQVEILVREAEQRIPGASAVAGPAASPAREEIARRDRKAHADRLSTEFALALIRVRVGPKAEAEADLRQVLAERAKLAAEEPANPQYQAQVVDTYLALGRLLVDTGQVQRAEVDLAKAQALAEEALGKQPADAAAAGRLADVLRTRNPVAWTVLRPTEVKSEGGATLTVQPDGSVLASGTRADVDRYTLTVQLPPGRLTALRVEALPDDSLPSRGPGRSDAGNFVLSELVVTIARPGGSPQPVRFRTASATFEQAATPAEGNPYGRWAAAAAIDGDAKGKHWGWAVGPRYGQPSEAVFTLASELAGEGATATVELHQNYGESYLLGRLRLSITTAPPWVVGLPADGLSPHARLGLGYLARGDARAAVTVLERAATAAPARSADEDLVMALAHQRAGETEAARASLAKASRLIERFRERESGANGHDRFLVQFLYREAKTLIEGKTDDSRK